MVAAISTTPRNPKTPSTPKRPVLSSSDNNNNNNNNNSDNTISRKPRTKEITSRYLPSSSSSYHGPMESPRVLTSTTTTRSLSVSFQGSSFSFQTTKPKPVPQNLPRKPKPKTQHLGSLTVRVLGQSVDFSDKVKAAAFDEEDIHLASDTSDSLSSESESSSASLKGRVTTRGISVPARFWPESFSPAKKVLAMDTQLFSPRMGKGCLPDRVLDSPMKGMASPLKGQQGNMVSILSFAAEARRVKKGETRIEEAHSMRLLYNRNLQWRFVNAQADSAISTQRVNSKSNLYHAWRSISDLRDTVVNKRIELQLLQQYLKLSSIIKGQMTHLEEWSCVDSEHHDSLSILIEALKARTLRLPIVGGARVDVFQLQSAVNSAIEVMQAMGTSISSLLSKVEGASSLVSELAKAAAHERALLEQSKDLLSTVAVLHVSQCSLHGQIMQLNHRWGRVKCMKDAPCCDH